MAGIRDVSGKLIATAEGIPVTTDNIRTLSSEQLANTHEIPAAVATVSTTLPGLDKVFPGPSTSVEHPAAAIESASPVTSTTNPPISNTTATAGTIMDYASRYGLLAGGILAALIIGTVIVKKIIKRKS